MKQTILISKHIHSTFASFSSNDTFLKVFTTSDKIDFNTEIGEVITSNNYPFINGEIIKEISGDDKFKAIYVEEDKTFYNKGLNSRRGFMNDGYHKTDDFKALIKSYCDKGWSIEKGQNAAQKAFWKRETKKQEVIDKKEGLVLWMSYDNRKKQPLTIYQGGFSDEVFNTKELQDYISGHSAYGWIGDSGTRKAAHDKVIEQGLRERGLSPQAMYNWISSSDGRHFADGLSWFKTLDEQIEEIKKNLNRIFNLCIIYSSTQHGGTMKSTCEIREDYETQGILLKEDTQSYDPTAWCKLMAVVLASSNSIPSTILN